MGVNRYLDWSLPLLLELAEPPVELWFVELPPIELLPEVPVEPVEPLPVEPLPAELLPPVEPPPVIPLPVWWFCDEFCVVLLCPLDVTLCVLLSLRERLLRQLVNSSENFLYRSPRQLS